MASSHVAVQHATLLRGTVKAMLPEHNLYITDWRDARDVPAALGVFHLDDFVTEIIECIRWIGHEVHVIAVCQPAVAAVAAAAVMAAMDDDREMIRTVRFQRQTGASSGRIYDAA